MIYQKSNHPVEVKRVPLRIWSLRQEIETAIRERLREQQEQGEEDLLVEDIQFFYSLSEEEMNSSKQAASEAEAKSEDAPEQDPSEQQDSEEEVSEEEDDDMAAMAAAIAESEEGEKEEEEEEEELVDEENRPIDGSNFQRPTPPREEIGHGFSFLADINMAEMLMFSQRPYLMGQTIVVEFVLPSPIKLTAKVVTCRNFSLRSRIISEQMPRYRLQLQLLYTWAGERSTLRSFLQSVEPELPKTPVRPVKVAEKKEDDDGDDEFNLDELGIE